VAFFIFINFLIRFSKQEFFMLKLFFLILSIFSIEAIAAPQFVDSSLKPLSCGRGSRGNIQCGEVRVIERDNRVAPAISQPVAEKEVMGLCGVKLPSGQDYQARPLTTVCGSTNSKINTREQENIDIEKKDEARQYLSSGMDDLTKRTKAQEVLKTKIEFNEKLSVPVAETWEYTQIVGDFNGPDENYETTCEMSRTEHWQVEVDDLQEQCTGGWETIPDPVSTPSGGGYSGGSGGGYSGGNSYNGGGGSGSRSSPAPAPSNNSDRMRGTGKQEIKDTFKNNYRKGSSLDKEIKLIPSRSIAENKRCLGYSKVKVGSHWEPRSDRLSSVTGRCIAQRGTWRTYPMTQKVQRTCGYMNVKVSAKMVHDQDWNPSNPNYLDILPNKYDLLPGESEKVQISIAGGEGKVKGAVSIDNAWNNYSLARNKSNLVACSLGDKELDLEIVTNGRIKRKAPNPFKKPNNRDSEAIPMQVVDDKGRPQHLVLIDTAREVRVEQSDNSRRFQNESQGKKAFWVGVQFRMRLYKVIGENKLIAVTLPNQFTTDATDIFEDEMKISLGGKGGMDRLFRPGGPLEFIFGGLYKYLGVELTPNTEYVLEVKSAQREFPFYESTCESGDVSCKGDDAKEKLFSEAIHVKFKTGETKRSFLKWLKDLQIVIF
jgi:uncharacterized membrane protein YgcG